MLRRLRMLRIASWVVVLVAGATNPALLASEEEYGPAPLERVERVPGPKIVFGEERFDFGTVVQGDPTVHTYRFRNEGDALLRLLDVRAGCQCTTFGDWKQFKEVPPGGEGTITVKLDTAKFKSGKETTKHTDVTSNDPVRPKVKLSLVATVQRVLEWKPENGKFEALLGRSVEGELEFIAPPGISLDLVQVEAAGQHVTVGALEAVETGKRWKVGLTAPASDTVTSKKASLTARVSLDTDKGKRDLTIPVPVSIQYTGRVRFDPREAVSFSKKETSGMGTEGAALPERKVNVSTGDPAVPFRVTQVEVLDAPAGVFATEIVEVAPGEKYDVIVTVREKVAQKFVRAKLVIHTDDPTASRKEMRLVAQFDIKAASP